MTEHVCSRKYVPVTKGTSHFGIVWNRNRWSVRHSGKYPKTSDGHSNEETNR